MLDPNAPLVDTSADVPGQEVSIGCPPAELGELLLTEILADPGGKDPDGDGNADNVDDEFVEVVNIGGREVALTNVAIETKSVHPLPAVCLPPNGAHVMWGKDANLSLTNSGATVKLLIAGSVADSHQYSATDGQSVTRESQLDKDSAWVPHSTVSDRDFSPGVCPNGSPFPNCTGSATDASGDGGAGGDADIGASCSGVVPTVGTVLINEILADPGVAIDTNGDGIPSSSDDEFIELVNVGDDTLDLSGATVRDAGGGTFTVPSGTCLDPNQALVLINRYDASASSRDFGDAVVLSMDNAFALNNSEESVALSGSDGTQLAVAVYGSEANDDQSVVREVDLDADSDFIKHGSAPLAAGATSSPGFCQNGQPFPNCGTATPELPTDVPATEDIVGELPTDVTMDTGPDAPPDVPACGPPAAPGLLIINEVMANPNDGNGGVDFNGDGTYSSSGDEYVEVVNIFGAAVDVNGMTLQIDSGALDTKLTVSVQGCLPPQGALLIFGPGTPNLSLSSEVIVLVGDKGLSLNNGGDEVAIVAADGAVIDTYAFGSAGAAESFAADPDGSGNMVPHSSALSAGGQKASPGTCLNGQSFTGCLP